MSQSRLSAGNVRSAGQRRLRLKPTQLRLGFLLVRAYGPNPLWERSVAVRHSRYRNSRLAWMPAAVWARISMGAFA